MIKSLKRLQLPEAKYLFIINSQLIIVNIWNNVYILLSAAVGVQGVFVEPPLLVTSQRSLAESETRLPCHYQVEEGQKVVQVTWFKELPDGTKDQIITVHFMDGHTGRLQREQVHCFSRKWLK